MLSAVQLLRDEQPVGRVVLAQREVVDAALTLPIVEAVLEVALDTRRSLVALLGCLGQQPHDNLGDSDRQVVQSLAGRHRSSGDMAVHPFDRVRHREWQSAGEHLVERDAQRVKVAARIDRAVHSTGLFGRHIGERACN